MCGRDSDWWFADVQTALNWAGEELSDESIDGFNALIGGDDKNISVAAVEIMNHARQHPDQFVTDG